MRPRCKPTRILTDYPSSTQFGSFAGRSPPSAAFPPLKRAALHRAILEEILDERVPPRAHRRNKRGVKRKMSNYPIRRKVDRPPPKINIALCIQIVI